MRCCDVATGGYDRYRRVEAMGRKFFLPVCQSSLCNRERVTGTSSVSDASNMCSREVVARVVSYTVALVADMVISHRARDSICRTICKRGCKCQAHLVDRGCFRHQNFDLTACRPLRAWKLKHDARSKRHGACSEGKYLES